MTRLLLPLVAALVAVPAFAQEAAVLGGWTLPDGTVVTTETSGSASLVMTMAGGDLPVESESATRMTRWSGFVAWGNPSRL